MSSLRAFWIAVLLLGALGAVTSVSEASTGLRVVGDSRFRMTAEQRIGAWLASHGHQVTEKALGQASLAALDECYLRDEPACANKIFVDSSESDLFLYVSFEANGSGGRERTVRGSLWLLRKDGEAAVFTEGCESCDDAAIASMIDKLTERVGSFDPRSGTLQLTSSPAGAAVEIDGKKAGVTPVTRELPAGSHQVALSRDGYRVERRTVEVQARTTVEEAVVLRPLATGSSRTRRIAAYGTATLAAALAAGGLVALVLHEGDTCAVTKRECFVGKPGGIAALAGAGVLGGVSTYLWLTMKSPESMESAMAPVARLPAMPRAYTFGFTHSF